MEEEPERVFHRITTCDECGLFPIVGTRYKSTTIYNYDCCERCWKDHHEHDRNDFAAFVAPKPRDETWAVAPARSNVIHALSAEQAKQQLEKFEELGLPVSPRAVFRVSPSITEKQGSEIVDFINSNPHLVNVSITRITKSGSTCDTYNGIKCLVEGLTRNTSVKLLTFILQESLLSFLVPLLENKEGIVFCKVLPLFGRLVKQKQRDATYSGLFQAVAKSNSLKTFWLGNGASLLSYQIKQHACETVKSNPNLTRLGASTRCPEYDNMVDVLTSFNRYHWLRRWTKESASASDRVDVVLEILEKYSGDEATSALFYMFAVGASALTSIVQE